MNDGGETVHVVFGWSIAYTLRRALQRLGSGERVIALPELLSVGPIDPPDPAVRQAWARSVLRVDTTLRDECDDEPIDADAAWAEATGPGIAPVFWACLGSAAEHACFLQYVTRMQDRPFEFIDATDLDVITLDGVERPWSLALFREQDIVAANLAATRRRLSAEALQVASQAWSRLRYENAPFRIVSDGRLVSAPLSHYDALLVAQASPDWEIAARLIGRAITILGSEPAWRGHANGDAVLFGRMLALADEGALEISGPGPGLRGYQVRRPAGV